MNVGNIYTKVYKAADLFGKSDRAVIYERSGCGMVTSIQLIGAVDTTISDDTVYWQGFERTIIEAETDGSVFFRGRIYEFLGMNTDIAGIGEYPRTGFYTQLFVKGGKFSGIVLNFKIPYYEKIRLTLIRDERDIGSKSLSWVTVRDTDEICISYGGMEIPRGAYLHSDKIIEKIPSGGEVTLLDTQYNGRVMSVSLFGKSDTFNFVEGCLRAYKSGSAEPMLISSGFEDYFGFCFGFNLGVIQFPSSGVTLDRMRGDAAPPFRVSAYRNHIDDPLTFRSGGFRLTVRNGDQNSGNMDIRSIDGMAGNGTGNAEALMGGQITYYTW